MKTVSYNNSLYYLDGAKPCDEVYENFFRGGRGRAVEEVDYFLAKRKHFAFHPRHLHDGYETLSWVYSFFHGLAVPSEDQVRRAMILQLSDNTGEGPENKYSIKAGGGSASDSIFVSSYSILVAHPKTGEDTWVVLMKKYSTRFSEVLISYEEIKNLFDLVATKAQKKERDAEYARDCVSLLLRGVNHGSVPSSKGNSKKCDQAFITAFLENNFNKASSEQWESALDFFNKRLHEELTHQFEEQPGRDVNFEHRTSVHKKIKSLARVRQYIFPEPAKVLMEQELQLEIF